METNHYAVFQCDSPTTESVSGVFTTISSTCGCELTFRNDDPEGFSHGSARACKRAFASAIEKGILAPADDEAAS